MGVVTDALVAVLIKNGSLPKGYKLPGRRRLSPSFFISLNHES